jgi:hypothetical protein
LIRGIFPMRIPILTYQPMRIHGNGYAENDLRALAADLRVATEAGFRIAPLATLVKAWLDGRQEALEGRWLALTCDAGSDFDYHDLPHPTAGRQRSVLNILRDFAAEFPGRQPDLHIASFVVVSPEARRALDAACMLGQGWWSEEWWPQAVASGLMHVASNSWDHNHDALPEALATAARRGTFTSIATRELAEQEIARAAAYLQARVPNPGAALFAYPYGEPNDYLTGTYFPERAQALGIEAAFTDRDTFFEPGSARWALPRFVCGRDWRSPDELRALLDAAADSRRAWVSPTRRETMVPPKAPPPAKPARVPTSLEVSATCFSEGRVASGLVGIQVEIEGPPPQPNVPCRLVLEVEGAARPVVREVPPTPEKKTYPFAINSHLLPDGSVRMALRVEQAGRVLWRRSFQQDIRNAAPLAATVRESLRAFGTPLVIDGLVDSGAFDIANPALTPWFDRLDANARIDRLRAAGRIDASEAAALAQFVADGYAILPAAIEADLLATIEAELDDAVARQVEGYRYGTSQRIHNLHHRYPGVRGLWRHPKVMRFLELVFDGAARPCQSLTYVFGSQQGAHQDTIHLTPFPQGYMCGVWVALEDVRPGSGELEVYRGSHRLPRVYMKGSGCEKITGDDWSQFDVTVSARWRQMLAENRFEKVTYRPKRGTVLVWHENLMHAGGVRDDLALSRRSIVSHYFADGAIAFYDSTGRPGHME